MFPRGEVSSEQIFHRTALFNCSGEEGGGGGGGGGGDAAHGLSRVGNRSPSRIVVVYVLLS